MASPSSSPTADPWTTADPLATATPSLAAPPTLSTPSRLSRCAGDADHQRYREIFPHGSPRYLQLVLCLYQFHPPHHTSATVWKRKRAFTVAMLDTVRSSRQSLQQLQADRAQRQSSARIAEGAVLWMRAKIRQLRHDRFVRTCVLSVIFLSIITRGKLGSTLFSARAHLMAWPIFYLCAVAALR